MGRIHSQIEEIRTISIIVISIFISGIVILFRGDLLIQGTIVTLVSAALSLTAWRESSRRKKLARFFMGPFILSLYIATIVGLELALVPAVVFWLLGMYYGLAEHLSILS